ncbi:hypothetical protein [Streptomyces sp. NPDC008121]|uniref:hypothetical protein n=1 Tax=Streptomyces sp. NPDC008121 TaxID=3364809 RepID=UPI0036F0856A
MRFRRRVAVIAVLAGIGAGAAAGSAAAADRPPVPQAAVSVLPDRDPVSSQAGIYSTFKINNYTGEDLRITKVEARGPGGGEWFLPVDDAFTPEAPWKPQPGDSLHSGRTFGVLYYIQPPEVRITVADKSGRTLEFGVKTEVWGAQLTFQHSESFRAEHTRDPGDPYAASIDIRNRTA